MTEHQFITKNDSGENSFIELSPESKPLMERFKDSFAETPVDSSVKINLLKNLQSQRLNKQKRRI